MRTKARDMCAIDESLQAVSPGEQLKSPLRAPPHLPHIPRRDLLEELGALPRPQLQRQRVAGLKRGRVHVVRGIELHACSLKEGITLVGEEMGRRKVRKRATRMKNPMTTAQLNSASTVHKQNSQRSP